MANSSKSTFDPNQVAAKVRVDTLTQQAGMTRSRLADVAKLRPDAEAEGLSLAKQVAQALAEGVPADTLSAAREACRVQDSDLNVAFQLLTGRLSEETSALAVAVAKKKLADLRREYTTLPSLNG